MKKVIKEVLEKVVPNNKERQYIRNNSRKVLRLINEEGYTAEIEGSIAKDTWISGNHDIDVFVFFSEDVGRDELEEKGLEIGKNVIKKMGGTPEVAYAEHPYVKGKKGRFNVDIVPCYDLEDTSKRISAVDRTPFHTSYVKEKLDERGKNEVRVLKQFMKGVDTYSAKEKVRGFSGYLCELLVIHYKSFRKVVQAATKKWEFGTVIDIERYYKNKKKLARRYKEPLIVIDPIDENRNVAAALDADHFEKFIFAAQEFLEDPKIEFFFPNEVTPLDKKVMEEELDKRGDMLVIETKTPAVIEDILYSQVRRSLHSIVSTLKRAGYSVMEWAYCVDEKTYFLIEFESSTLPKIKKLTGPPLDVKQSAQDKFTTKYKKYKPWIEGKRWYVEVPRKFVNAKDSLKFLLKDPRRIGIASHVAESIDEGYKIIEKDRIMKRYKEDFAAFITQYVTKKNPWEW